MPRRPLGEDLVALAGIGADADRAADMVQDDRGRRKRPRQIGQFAELREIHPGVEAEPERVQFGEPVAQIRLHQQPGRPVDRRAARRLVRVRSRDKSDAAEPAAARRDHRFQHPLDPRAEHQIGMADNPGADPRLAVSPAAAMAATPLANSTSPTGRISAGPSGRYIDSHSR